MTATDPKVRQRPAGPWTPTVARILDDLAAAGIHAPRHLGLDGNTETVTHLEGLVPARPYPPEVLTDDALASVGALLRRHHDALDPDPRPGTQALAGWPDRPPDTVCHNDCGPWNIVYRNGKAEALIDWDLARPGPASLDLALAAWHHIPLYNDGDAALFGWATPPNRYHRLRLLCDAYGLALTPALLDDVATWHHMTIATARWAHRNPTHPAARPWLKVNINGVEADRHWLRYHAQELLA